MASRSTFRDAAGDVAWQRQLRDRYAAEGVPPVPHLDVKRAVVRPVSRRMAEQIILKYEWLGTMHSNTTRHFGIFFGSYCAGVCCVGGHDCTGGSNIFRGYAVARSELAILARGACVHWAPAGTNSRLVAWSARLLRAASSYRIIAAFADSDAGEIGTIYQAANWSYVGQGKSTTQYVAPNGRIYDQKIVYDTRKTAGNDRSVSWSAQRDALLDAGWRPQQSNPKHRYVCVLDRSDRALVERIESMRQPYPKRDVHARAKHPSDAPGVQPGEGGAAPTRTLHEAAL